MRNLEIIINPMKNINKIDNVSKAANNINAKKT